MKPSRLSIRSVEHGSWLRTITDQMHGSPECCLGNTLRQVKFAQLPLECCCEGRETGATIAVRELGTTPEVPILAELLLHTPSTLRAFWSSGCDFLVQVFDLAPISFLTGVFVCYLLKSDWGIQDFRALSHLVIILFCNGLFRTHIELGTTAVWTVCLPEMHRDLYKSSALSRDDGFADILFLKTALLLVRVIVN